MYVGVRVYYFFVCLFVCLFCHNNNMVLGHFRFYNIYMFLFLFFLGLGICVCNLFKKNLHNLLVKYILQINKLVVISIYVNIRWFT